MSQSSIPSGPVSVASKVKERVVSRKVVGSANPVARKFRDIKSAFAGVGCGFVMIIIGFVLIFASVKSVKEHSKTVATLPLQAAEEIQSSDSGMVKIKGLPEVTNQKVLTYQTCTDQKCQSVNEELLEVKDALYLEASYERYELVEKTRTETRYSVENGQDVEETVEIIEYEEEWVEQKEESFWSDFKLANVSINPEKAKRVLEMKSVEVENVFIPNLKPAKVYNEPMSAKVGETRLVINYAPNNEELIVVGNLNNLKIQDGDSFIVSDQEDAQLVESLGAEEATTRLIMRIGAWLLLTLGFAALIAPIFEFIEMIPLFGKMAKAVAGFVGAVLSAIIVIGGVIIVKYWFICLGGIILLIGTSVAVLVIVLVKKKGGKVEPVGEEVKE